jgi:hypothetical protein
LGDWAGASGMATGSWLRHGVWLESKIANIEYVKR